MSKLLVANWKMYLTHNESISWIQDELPGVLETLGQTEHELIICPSYTVLPFATQSYPERTWGAQDCGYAVRGAFTGDVSPASLTDLNIGFTLVGHSERRQYHGEMDDEVAHKAALLLQQGINPLVCIGESEEDKENWREVLETQLDPVLEHYTPGDDLLFVAYEPDWAIGTGETPSPEELEEVRDYIIALCGDLECYIFYGGSIDETSAKDLSSVVNGLLIGSASVNSDLLKKIILSC